MDNAINRDKLVADAKVVLGDVESLLSQAAATSGQQAHELRERAAEALHRAKLRLSEAQVAIGERTRAGARVTDDWVHAHPWGSIGIGAAVGFMLGLLVGRR
jgi:ElaB/YqjD/DUF883 family membrane-anchored ribosome-binding protein